jgi:hypothetical protein
MTCVFGRLRRPIANIRTIPYLRGVSLLRALRICPNITIITYTDWGPYGFHGQAVRESNLLRVEYLTPERIEKAWHLFRTFSDHEFSFTDCTSFVLMENLKIKTTFTFDAHFQEYGKFNISP